VLAVGGSDPSGGAGIQADLRVTHAHGLWGMAAITALTVQGPTGVREVHPVSAAVVAAQVRVVLEEVPPAAIKLGMLCSGDTVDALVSALSSWRGPLVMDPVLRATSGGALLDADGISRLPGLWLNRTGLLTPNLPEAAALGIDDPGAFAARTGWSLLVKGGHGDGEVLVDRLFQPDGTTVEFRHVRRAGVDLRGTGCRLASAIAASWAGRLPLSEAVRAGISWLQHDLMPGPDG
jgi:hydroxymethylpyrimidine/phosphomethylpyrimidine kinase